MGSTLKPSEVAAKFVALCTKYGFTYFVKATGVVCIMKAIAVNDNDAFSDAEMESSIILDYVPLKGGSTWGTDGGSMGGMIAMTSGKFTMNKSGTGNRFLTALKAIPYGG